MASKNSQLAVIFLVVIIIIGTSISSSYYKYLSDINVTRGQVSQIGQCFTYVFPFVGREYVAAGLNGNIVEPWCEAAWSEESAAHVDMIHISLQLIVAYLIDLLILALFVSSLRQYFKSRTGPETPQTPAV